MPEELDQFDRRIMALMQEDASRSTAEIAELVGMSQSPCWRRIQRLKDEGYICRQVAIVDRRKVGLNAQVFALVKLTMHGRQNLEEFAGTIRTYPEVLECHVLMGAFDFLIRVVAADIDAYHSFFFEKLSRLPGVQEVNSVISLSEIKSTTALPL
ncbi:MAG: Lrp/AsnC family transcriptional regulator [Mesorhizobium sp.]|jgi:Lrp/AsnC family transcriptional regulator|uniref:Lrp/AsnC family transcriptional regulator n=1 Tax=Neomesorhizobium albiziae TaxID=335020 RepID=A0A1I3VM23_9HYPH|nr:Lrp/AsnC family transcriptional regulator [Mesorhizobium albiziae]GLS28965.1 AsnC family transcriptional regulator [Mesorhizobium albiziae]SFJ95297.1 Lrp/AsnC family transcriptional regulator [Mesorhizobium albiziae]